MARRNPVISTAPGAILRVLSRQEVGQYVERWLEEFGRNGFGGGSKQYLWHIFSAETYPSASGAEALNAYAEASALKYVVVSNDKTEGFETDARPTSCSFSDYYVFPENLAWTMAFTHEDGWLGPYFARHRDFDRRNEENLRKIQKAVDAASAKKKGWA
jgi:hypothetical protein